MAASVLHVPQGQGPSSADAKPRAPLRRRDPLAPSLALGIALARRGPLAVVAMTVSAMAVLGFAVLAVSFARRGGDAPVQSVPILVSSALAWGGGFLHAVAVSVGALRRDRLDGVRDLIVTRTLSPRGYLAGRVGGLVVVLAATVAGGTALVASVALLAVTQARAAVLTLQSTFGSVLFALAFAAVIAPLAFAVLGARSRISGYLGLLGVLVIPEVVVELLSSQLPSELLELCSIPSALAALRASVAAGPVDPLRFLRAVVALVVFVVVASLFARRDATRVEREGA